MELFIRILSITFFLVGSSIIAYSQNFIIDSLKIYSGNFNGAEISIYTFKQGNKKDRGKIFISSENQSNPFILRAFTQIDEVIKVYEGKDNFGRESFSLIYRGDTGCYFIAASKINGKWESTSANFMRFIELTKSNQIKKITFANRQPKVFKVEFENPSKHPSRTYAEINGKLEQIECYSCFFND